MLKDRAIAVYSQYTDLNNCLYMKAGYLICLLSFYSAGAFAQPVRPSITIYSVDFRTETIIGIPCDQFMTQFARQLDTTVYRAPDTLRPIALFLQHIHPSRHHDHLDTRASLVFINSRGKATEICMDRWDLCVNGKIIRADPAFYKYLQSLVPKEHLHMRPTGL
jgi:hypothetical protein